MSSGASRKRRRTRRRHLLPTLGVGLVVATLLSAWLVVDLRRQLGPSGKAVGAPTGGQAGLAGPPEEAPSSAPSPSSGGLTSSTATVAPGATPRSRPGPTEAAKPLPPAVLGARVAGVAALSDLIQDEGIGVPLSGGRTLWIFADTTKVGGAPHFFVTSSAAVSVGDSRKLTYATGGKDAPIEFLPRTSAERVGQSGQRYNGVWPTGATKLPDGRIIISYAKYDVTLSPQRFQFLGAGLYEYRDPGASFAKAGPAKRIADDMWKMTDGVVGSPVYSDGYVYFTECESLQCYSLRTTPATLADRSKYTWWTGDGWSAFRDKRKPMSYGSGRPGKNPSTVYLPMYDLFAVVDTAAGHTQRSGQLWVGPNPWGPWSKPASFALPECPPAGCYTLNLHAGTSLPGRLRVSYATSGVGPYVRVVDVPVRIGPTRYGPSVATLT